MTDSSVEKIPFAVDLSRILEVLAKQIYQDPLALLRENSQNAFDAIRLRLATDADFVPRIDIQVKADSIEVADNGIGMTWEDLKEHYWRAGSSSKNTPEALAAGVVGTFGIGAMANFGIAESMVVETESRGQRTRSSADRRTLSTSEDTITLESLLPQGEPGTVVRAQIPADSPVNVAQATAYITDFVAFVDIPVFVNGHQVNTGSIDDAVPSRGDVLLESIGHELSTDFTTDLTIRVDGNGEIWLRAANVQYRGQGAAGGVILRQSEGSLRTFRSGFGLATVGVTSTYQFGGVADLALLQPTAGREALTTESMQVLQLLIAQLDAAASEALAGSPLADSNVRFMEWVRRHGRYELCEHLNVRVEPDAQKESLASIRDRSKHNPVLVYAGADSELIKAVATDDSKLLVVASTKPRRQCELEFLNRFCNTESVSDSPQVIDLKPEADWSRPEHALVFRISTILETDYFLPARVGLGTLTHGLPILVEATTPTPEITLDPTAQSFSLVASLYESDYQSFGSMAKDFVRNVVFQRVSDLVPSSTRQGAEAFLKSIRRRRDIFEYEYDDLEPFESVWKDYVEGRITMAEATSRSNALAQRNVQTFDRAAAMSVRDVVPDVVDNEAAIATEPVSPGPAPAILRTEVESEAKLLTLSSEDEPVRGFRCFLALTEKAFEERIDFFLQPHTTSVVWGGQKVLFVFEHHSGEFGLYYDLQTGNVASEQSGGGPVPTATLILKNRLFIPVPDEITTAFIPAPDERKRFEVKWDFLYTD